jgi:hypothetical protein
MAALGWLLNLGFAGGDGAAAALTFTSEGADILSHESETKAVFSKVQVSSLSSSGNFASAGVTILQEDVDTEADFNEVQISR